LKVLYGIGWVLVIVIVLITFYLTKPTGQIIADKSGFSCPDGQSYTWKNLAGYYSQKDKVLNETDHAGALAACGLNKPDDETIQRMEKARIAGVSEAQIQKEASEYQIKKSRLNPPYKLSWVTDKSLSKWLMAIFWAFVALLVANFALDTIRNIVLYIAFGKLFSYPFLKYWWEMK